MSPRVYRVQDHEGRGPWRPGFSHRWIDGEAPEDRLAETLMDLVPMVTLQTLPRDRHYGCGCRSLPELMRWFTPVERARLERFGYWPVEMSIDHVLAESAWQVFFARSRPLVDGATRRRWQS